MSTDKKLTMEEKKQRDIENTKKFMVDEDKARKENPKKLTIYDATTEEERKLLMEEGAVPEEDDVEQEAELDRENTDNQQPEKTKGPIWEEGDIIDMMFKKWLVAGMDKLSLEAIDAFKYGFYKAMYNHENKKKEERELKGEKADKTTSFKESTLDYHKSHLKAKMDICDEKTAVEDFKLLFKTVRDGNPGDVDEATKNRVKNMIKRLSPEVKKTIAQMSPEQRAAKFSDENAKDFGTAASKNAIAINQFAANYAEARMLSEKSRDSKAFEGQDSKQIFALYELEARRDFLNTLAVADQKGLSTAEIGTNLVKNSALALKKALSNINDGKYEEKDKKYHNMPDRDYNPYLEHINVMINENKTPPERANPMSPQMAALQMSADVFALSAEQQALRDREGNTRQNRENHNARRASAKERINAMRGFTVEKANIPPRNIDISKLRYAPNKDAAGR